MGYIFYGSESGLTDLWVPRQGACRVCKGASVFRSSFSSLIFASLKQFIFEAALTGTKSHPCGAFFATLR